MNPIQLFRAGPPPPRVELLSDALFFVRAVPLSAPEPGDKRSGELGVAAQVELALESVSPFPVAQLYYGYFWMPGSAHALVYAAYRRRFTADQVAGWHGAEAVMPAFAAVLGGKVEPATTVVLSAPEGLTGLHWESGQVPSKVAFQPLAPEATEDDREKAHAALIRGLGEARKVVDLSQPPAAQSRRSDREMVFHSDDFESRLASSAVVAADIRDKADLAALRRAQKRDVVLWRVGIGCLAAFVVMAICELGLLGGGAWQKVRLRIVKLQTPVVDKIMTAQDIARQINQLSTQRLLPMEMITMVEPRKFGATIQFLRTSTTGLYTLTVDAQTSNPGEISSYQNSIEALAACDKVEIRDLRTQNNVASFTLVITFKPNMVAAAPSVT